MSGDWINIDSFVKSCKEKSFHRLNCPWKLL